MTSFSFGPPQPEGYSPPLIPPHQHPVLLQQLLRLEGVGVIYATELALWQHGIVEGLTAILHNQASERRLLDLLYHALFTISGKEDLLMLNTQELIDAVSAVAGDVQQAQADQLAVVNGLDDLKRQLGDNVEAQNTLDALATKLRASHDTLSGIHTALTSAVAQDDPPAPSDPAPTGATTPDQPTSSGSGDGTTSGSGTAPDGSSGTSTDGGTTPTEVPSSALPLYVYSGDSSLGSIDTSAWTRAGNAPDGRALYTYAGDSPGGAPTGGSADWTPYTPSA